ncbi:MAG: S-layer homology domain-containing protein [Clostridia bacterium]|nr:S-layer homology domain-containing protein [Clostridia bacterium]
MKRILSLVLIIGMLITSLVPTAFAEETENMAAEDAVYYPAVTVLSALGIMEGKSDTDFGANDFLTRAEMSTIAVRFVGLDSRTNSGVASVFTDVPADHWARYSIDTAAALELVHGNGDGSFDPEGSVTAEQAIKILVNALGYEPKALQMGGYPGGYVTTANQLGMLKGIDFSEGMDKPIPRCSIAMLVYNALEADLMEIKAYGDNQYSAVSKDTNALGAYHDTEKRTGTVTATYESAMDGKDLEPGEVIIDGESYTTDLNLARYVGYEVDYYCREIKGRNKYEIIAAFPVEDEAEDEIDFDDVESVIVSDNLNVQINYYKDKGKTDRINASEPVIMYNGKAESFSDAAEAQEFLNTHMAQGHLSYLKGSGTSDVIFLENYEAYVISDVNPERNWISYNIYTIDGTKRGMLELSNEDVSDRRVFYYDAEGNEILMGDLSIGDVIMVYASSDKTIYNIYRSLKEVTGTIEAVETLQEPAGIKLYIEGVGYESVKSLDSSLIPTDEEVTLLLDSNDKIAGYVSEPSKSSYGLLMDVGFKKNAFGKGALMLKILKTDGTMEIYETRDEVTAWNGTKVTKMDASSLVTSDPVDPMTDWELWSTDNASEFTAVPRTWLTDSDKSDAASRKIIYYKTDSEGKVHTVLVPSMPEEHPESKITMLHDFGYHPNPWLGYNNISHSVGARMLSYADGTYLNKDCYTHVISNFATVYEAVSMDYDETDYRVLPAGITELTEGNVIDGMDWTNAQLYCYPGSDTVDFMIVNPKRPSNGSPQHKVVIVDTIAERIDGYTLKGYSDGLPYSMPIKKNTRLIENILVTSIDENMQLVTKDMLPGMALDEDRPYTVFFESDVMGNQETPYVSPDNVHSGDVVRILERDGEIVSLEIVRRKATGVVTMYNATYTSGGMYGALLQWNTCIRGEIVEVDTALNILTIKGYYWTGTPPVANVSAAPVQSSPVVEFTTYLHLTNSGAAVYDLETGDCRPAQISDYEVGDEIFSWKYTSSPADVIIFKNGD